MSEVTVKAIQPVLGLDDGAVVTIERTPRVDAAIRAGALAVVVDRGAVVGIDADEVAVASAGASLVPSPVIATRRPSDWY